MPDPNVESIEMYASDSKTLVLDSHGRAGAFGAEYYSSASARDDNLWVLQNALGYGEDELETTYLLYSDPPQNIAYGIKYMRPAIESRLSNVISPDALIVGNYCESSLGSNSWGATSECCGRSFIGWGDTTQCGPATWALQHLFANLGCLVDNAWIHSEAAAREVGMVHAGYYGNRLNCAKGCDRLATLGGAAFDGRAVLWQVSEERAGDEYVVRGRRVGSEEWLVVATVAATSDAEQYEVRSHRVEVVGGLESVKIEHASAGVARRGSGVIFPDAFAYDSLERARARVAAGGLLSDEADLWRNRGVDRQTERSGLRVAREEQAVVAPTGISSPGCSDCGDILIYSTDHVLALTAQDRYGSTSTYPPSAFNNHCQRVIGSGDLLEARAALEDLVETNIAWNASSSESDRKYPTDPMLVIVGSRGVVPPLYFANDYVNTCQQPACASYFDAADLTGDGRPDCPVQVMPVDNVTDLNRMIAAAEDWNAGAFVDPNELMLMFCSDVSPTLQVLPQEEAGCEAIRELYEASGRRTYLPLVESQARVQLDFWGRRQHGIDMINAGVRDLWVQGAYTESGRMTDFAWGDEPSHPYPIAALTKKQRMMVYAPGCWTASDRAGVSFDDDVPRRWLLNDPEGTMAAGVLGSLDSGWDVHFAGWRQILASALLGAPTGKPIGRVVFDAVRSLPPDLIRLGRSVVLYGGFVRIRHDTVPTEALTEPGVQSVVRVGPNPARESVVVSFHGRPTGQGTIRLIDASGREVRRAIVHEQATVTVPLRTQDGRLLPGGVYFVRVSSERGETTHPIVAVR
ncbi:MAG: T9SS type A sorting domain-containing protein [Candidatus Eisenbacteria bacterium]|nr:T9SS type A sorting domain-containing protein [Candidatus Eisenbacteria bacterium]